MEDKESLELVKIMDDWLFDSTGKRLEWVQKALLEGSVQDLTYEKIKEKYRLPHETSTLSKDIGYKLWKHLNEELKKAGIIETAQDVNKKNVGECLLQLQNRLKQPASNLLAPDALNNKNLSSASNQKSVIYVRQDWDGAPAIDVFYGRNEEIKKLHQWIVSENCKLLTIFGFRGIGTTSLAVKVAKKSQSEFEFVIWRSLRYAPPLIELLADLRRFFCGEEIDNFVSVSSAILQLISALKETRCLVVLDAWQEVFSSGETAGYYREGYEEYGEFLKRLAQSNHKSCVVLTSWEKPKEIAVFERANSGVHSLQIQGLGQAATDIFRDKNLKEEERWEELIKVYRGNPFALNVVGVMIKEVFAGNVSEFLQKNTLFLGDIENLLYEQFKRLSIPEKEMMVLLEKAKQPVSFTQLHEKMPRQISQSKLIEFLQSLKWRCLIESYSRENETLYSLQPMVMRYIRNQTFR